MIRFENVTTESFSDLSFSMQKGSICKVITGSDYDATIFLETLLGLNPPASGKVFLFDCNIYESSESEVLELFKRLGVVWKDGGLVSNLKVGENMVLPLWYHKDLMAEEVEEELLKLFNQIVKNVGDLKSYLWRLSGTLPSHEKRIIGFVRTLLLKPELIIYDSPLSGLTPETASDMMRMAGSYKSENADRASLYIAAEDEAYKNINADLVLRQKNKRF